MAIHPKRLGLRLRFQMDCRVGPQSRPPRNDRARLKGEVIEVMRRLQPSLRAAERLDPLSMNKGGLQELCSNGLSKRDMGPPPTMNQSGSWFGLKQFILFMDGS